MKLKLNLFFLGIFLCGAKLCLAQEVIRDLRYDWVVYNTESRTYVPAETLGRSAISFPLDTKKYADYQLLIEAKGTGSVIVNNMLIHNSYDLGYTSEIWSIDSLSKVFRTDSLFITIHDLGDVQTNIIRSIGLGSISGSSKNLVNPKRMNYENSEGTMVLILLMTGLLLGLFRSRFPKLFRGMFYFQAIFRLRMRDSVFYELKVFQYPNLLLYSLFGLLLLLIHIKIQHSEADIELIETELFILASIFVLGFLHGPIKYLLVSFFGGLFNLSKYTKYHYMEYLRLSMLIAILVVLSSFVFQGPEPIHELYTAFIVVAFVAVILLYIKLLSNSGDKKLYLFAYICSTEIIPLLFIVKIFI